MTSDYNISQTALKALQLEINGLEDLKNSIDHNFEKVVHSLSAIKGKIILSGMGKSGHVARKIAATLASTGSPSFFVHPGEASHGDLGMISSEDVVILLSNSGETAELKSIINYTKRFNLTSIAITSNANSSLATQTNHAIIIPKSPEAVNFDAPTTSTTMMMALGDIIAVCLIEIRGFKKDDFGIFHPGGRLGASFVKVASLMHKEENIPCCYFDDDFTKLVSEVNSKKLGCTIIKNKEEKAIGIFTDGDIRRALLNNKMHLKAFEICTPNPILITENKLAVEALDIMNKKLVTSLIVVDESDKVVGLLHIHDCLKAGVSPAI